MKAQLLDFIMYTETKYWNGTRDGDNYVLCYMLYVLSHYWYFFWLLALTLDYLFNSLGNSSAITRWDNRIGDDGAMALGDALKVNHSLKTLK